MQSIGEQLEAARKTRGVTLGDAANATKIREEYLLSLETSDGQGVPLERIYVRGFIRNYAKFLRMDAAKLIADYDAGIKSEAAGSISMPKAQKEVIGRLELGNEAPPQPVLQKDETPDAMEAVSTPRASSPWKMPKLKIPAWVWPVAAGFVAIIALWVVGANIAGAMKDRQANSTERSLPVKDLKLFASGDVTVIVKQAEDGTTLFAGTMKRGEEKKLTVRGGTQLQYSDGSQLSYEKDGKRTRVGSSGAGRKVLD